MKGFFFPISNNPISKLLAMASFFVCCSGLAVPLSSQLQNVMDQYTRSGSLPGIVLGVFIDDQESFYLTSGVGNIQTQQPIRTDELFKFGSTIKTITAIVLLDILNSKNITLKITLGDILKEYHNAFSKELEQLSEKYPFIKKITLNQLLNHTSQLANEQFSSLYLTKFVQAKDATFKLEDNISYSLNRGMTAKRFGYANVNYILLGKIVEILYNKPFKTVIENEIFKKLDLQDVYYYYSSNDINKLCPLFARGYEKANLGAISVFKKHLIISNYKSSEKDYIDVTCSYDPSWDDGPAGALLANPIQMGLLAKSIFSKTFKSAQNYWEFIEAEPDDPDAREYWGPLEMIYKLGIWRGQYADMTFWRMIGEQWGFSGGALFLPKQKNYSHATVLIYAINTDRPEILEGNHLTGLIVNLLKILRQN